MGDKSNIKVGTMTFHLAHNYGAMLQGYALQRAICNLGYDCEVIDYRFPYIDRYNKIWYWNDYKQKDGIAIGSLKYIKRCLKGGYKDITPLHHKFDNFMRKSMRLSKKSYFSSEKLKETQYDVVVFGSDQIWNPELTGGSVSEYFGEQFDASTTKLVSYAASCGTDGIKAEYKEKALPLLKRFKRLGIREDSFTEFLKNDYGLEARTVVDPVFLLSRNEWDKLISDTTRMIEEPYLLIYAFQEGEEIYNLARKIANERKLKLVTISYREKPNLEDMTQLTDCGPKEFVSLIKNADFVCTTSFHGTAFSVLYNKNFYCIGHPLYSQRNRDLLQMVKMTDRMVTSDKDVIKISDCDYFAANELLEINKKQSLDFLREAIDC